LGPVIEQRMTQFDGLLVDAAQHLPLIPLTQKLLTVAAALDQISFVTDVAACVAEFKNVIPVLKELHASLQVLVVNHNSLQIINDALRPLDSPRVSPEEIHLTWRLLPNSLDILQPATVEDWYLRLLTLRADLDQALAAVGDRGDDGSAVTGVRNAFFAFR